MGGGTGRLPRAAQLGLLLIVSALAAMLALPRRAAADDIDDSISRLRRSRAYKVRLSAALFLARQGGPRAIMALARAAERDDDAIVRRVAALSLGRAARGAADGDARRAAVGTLERAARRDRDRQVRRSARVALDRLRSAPVRESQLVSAAAAIRPDPSAAGRIFVHIGQPADLSRALPTGSGRTLLEAVRATLRAHAPEYLTSDVLPTRAELDARGLRGFTVNARVARVAVASVGNHADVTCTVSLRVGPWSGSDGNELIAADVSASATGNGHITSSPGGTRRAAVDCAVAVVEELAAREVVPFLRRLASPAQRSLR
ncbi:MAG TPA: HEAT repeat domain-containing protein [Kofleriaceae bacterium]|nr:HEAT repeat domain-containing protein [Kofleriaceae bacterium]